MEDVDLVHKPGQHPLLPVPKELHVRPSVANVQAAEILKQMMEDAPAAEDQVLDISAGVQASPRKPTVLASSPAAGISAAEQTAFRNPPEAIPAMKAESRINLPPFPSPPSTSNDTSTSTPEQTEEEDPLSNGCDLPIPKAGNGYLPKVDLNPGLSSLSPQHPTRVWNSLLHACPPEHQPIIQWQFTHRQNGYVATMTLTLPPSHPVLKALHGESTLSQETDSTEYSDAVRRLGGEKSWTGQTKRLKAEAQNDAIRQCIADNGLLWANYEVMRSVDPGTYLGDCAARTCGGRPMLVDPVQPSQLATKRPIEDGHMGGRSIRPKLTKTTASTDKPPYLNTEDAVEPGNGHSGEFARESTITTEAEAARVTGGRWGQVDWQQHLNTFCLEAGLPVPKYYQRIERQQGASTLFFGQVTVEHDHFESDKGFVKLREARQEVARLVFCEHFGQEPAL